MLFNIIAKHIINSSFSDVRLEELSGISSYAGRIKYCREKFQKLAAGSSRIVYVYDNTHVLKVAKNEKGVAQNTTENDWMMQQGYSDIITKVVHEDRDDRWLICERAKKITPTEFKSILGFSERDLFLYMSNILGRGNNFHIDEKVQEILGTSEWVHEVLDMAGTFGMPLGDFGRISSYGKINNRVVLTDYGLTKGTYEEYYAR